MTAVAELQLTGVGVEQSDEHSHEHVGVVVLGQLVVHVGGDVFRLSSLGGQHAEQLCALSHEQ